MLFNRDQIFKQYNEFELNRAFFVSFVSDAANHTDGSELLAVLRLQCLPIRPVAVIRRLSKWPNSRDQSVLHSTAQWPSPSSPPQSSQSSSPQSPSSTIIQQSPTDDRTQGASTDKTGSSFA